MLLFLHLYPTTSPARPKRARRRSPRHPTRPNLETEYTRAHSMSMVASALGMHGKIRKLSFRETAKGSLPHAPAACRLEFTLFFHTAACSCRTQAKVSPLFRSCRMQLQDAGQNLAPFLKLQDTATSCRSEIRLFCQTAGCSCRMAVRCCSPPAGCSEIE
ncbi:hypothetical protein OE88DRAFT_924282 [Heliocybe sulcata]|uniref:Uncharacterized protein n=1 Tax=Heliocybe sulcata TaxID=5364 RepID=A0A5C3MQB7_9AGAM|nr:hypothetical protein OE88DRAFT_924282 [Heliocybe sulcata]